MIVMVQMLIWLPALFQGWWCVWAVGSYRSMMRGVWCLGIKSPILCERALILEGRVKQPLNQAVIEN